MIFFNHATIYYLSMRFMRSIIKYETNNSLSNFLINKCLKSNNSKSINNALYNQ